MSPCSPWPLPLKVLFSFDTSRLDMIAGTIEMSGSAWDPWVLHARTEKHSDTLIAQLGCPRSGKELKKCLKSKTVAEMAKASMALVGNAQFWRG